MAAEFPDKPPEPAPTIWMYFPTSDARNEPDSDVSVVEPTLIAPSILYTASATAPNVLTFNAAPAPCKE